MGVRRNKLLVGVGAMAVVAAAMVGVWWFFLRHGELGEPARFQVRAARRAYDGAPPVIPHPPLGSPCASCHARAARELPGLGVAPPSPHFQTPGMSAASNCQQCHVFQRTGAVFVANAFAGLPQLVRRGERLYPGVPPIIPHHGFMREDCNACHSGPACRPEIRCSHQERVNCLQCHARAPSSIP